MSELPRESLIADETTTRHFRSQGYVLIRSLMARVGQGDTSAINQFLRMTQPVMESIARRVGPQILGEGNVDDETVKELVNDVLLSLTRNPHDPRFFMGNPSSWNNFARTFEMSLRARIDSELLRQEEERHGKELLTSAAEMPSSGDPYEAVVRQERAAAAKQALTLLTPRGASILWSLHAQEEAQHVVADAHGTSARAIQKLNEGAKHMLQHSPRAAGIRAVLDKTTEPSSERSI